MEIPHQQLTRDGRAAITRAMDRVLWKRVWTFLALVALANGVLAGSAYGAGVPFVGKAAVWLGTVYMMVPLGVAVFLTKAWGEPTVANLRLIPKASVTVVVSILGPLSLPLGATALALLFPEVTYAPDLSGLLERLSSSLPADQVEAARKSLAETSGTSLFIISLVQGLAAGCTINALVAMGEEGGWRGFLLRELAPLGFWKSSLFIGVVWGLWHAPLILQGYNYPQHPVLGVLLMTLFTVLLSPVLTWVAVDVGSTWAPAVAHGVINGTAGAAVLLLKGGDDLTTGVTGFPGLMVLVALNLLILKLGPPDIRTAFKEQTPAV